MKNLIVVALILMSSTAFARGVGYAPDVQKRGNTTVITHDKRVIYGNQSKEFYQVEAQTVCKKGNKCHRRGVATHIPTNRR